MTRIVRGLMVLSLTITFAQLSRETAHEFLFMLIGLVLLIAAIPYLLAMAAIRRAPERWAQATGIVACLFGVVDAVWRVQAFFFPTPSSNREMALWLPVYGLFGIPFFALLANTFLTVLRQDPEE